METSTPTKIIFGYDDKTVIVSYANGNIYTLNYLTGKKNKFPFKESKKKASLYLGDSSTLVFGNKLGHIDFYNVR